MTTELLLSVLPFAGLFVVLYFFMIRPEKRRQQNVYQMQQKLQKNDKVVTIGGIHGIIDEVKDDTITLIIASGQRIKFEKAAIKRINND